HCAVEGRPHGPRGSHRLVRKRTRRWLGCGAGQPRPNGVRRPCLPHGGIQGRPPTVLCHQESPILGRQQAHRLLSVRGLPGPKRSPAARLGEAAALSGLSLSNYIRRRLSADDTLQEELTLLRKVVVDLGQLRDTRLTAIES